MTFGVIKDNTHYAMHYVKANVVKQKAQARNLNFVKSPFLNQLNLFPHSLIFKIHSSSHVYLAILFRQDFSHFDSSTGQCSDLTCLYFFANLSKRCELMIA